MEIKRIDRQKIIEEIKENGYADKLISYEELQELHKKYGMGMTEREFAQKILGVSYDKYNKCKRESGKTRILKIEQTSLSQGVIQEKIEILIERGYSNRAIALQELQDLCAEFGNGMTEKEFAKTILGISNKEYENWKYRGGKHRILKKEKTEEEIQSIREKLKERGLAGKSVSYAEIQALYREYGKEMTEIEFVQKILGVAYSNYENCKYNTRRKVRILKESLTFESQEETIKILIERGYAGKLISYEELQELYREYGQKMTETKFAQTILGITYSNYRNCRYKGTKVKILKKEEIKLSAEEIQQIKEKLKQRGYAGKSISYEKLQELHEQYGNGLTEIEFAQTILGISYKYYGDLKYRGEKRGKKAKILKEEDDYPKNENRGKKVKILKKSKIELSAEEIRKTIEQLKEKGYIGKLISYQEFQEMYKEYGNGMAEQDFAGTILGISYPNFKECKYRGQNVVVKDGRVIDITNEVKTLYFNKPDYYSKEFINDVCREYDITIEDFITYIVFGRFYDTAPIIKILEEKSKLWIGRTSLTEEFVARNASLIQNVATNISNSLCHKYTIKSQREDYAQDLIIYIIQNLGEEEKNFGDDLDVFRDRIYGRTKKYCEGMILNGLKISSKYTGLVRLRRRGKHDGEFEMQIADERADIEKQEIKRETTTEWIETETEKCIKLLSQYVELGYNRSESIAMTAEQMGIDANTMLQYMQQYLITKGKVRIKKSGQVEVDVR